MKNPQTQPITLDMTIGQVVEKYPQASEVMLGYGLHCVGCAVNPYETIEQGALGHGMVKEMIDDMLKDLNFVVTKKPAYKLNKEGVTLSPKALENLSYIAQAEAKEGYGLKIKASKQDKGLDYFLDLIKDPEEKDVVVIQADVRIYIDQDSLALMNPSVIDYVKGVEEEGFKIISLQPEERCACDKPMSQCGCEGEKKGACCGGGCC